MERSVSLLADMVLEAAVVVGLDSLVGEVDLGSPDGPGWVVGLTEDDAIAVVVSTGELAGLPGVTTLSRVLDSYRAVVTAHPECSVVAAISSWAFTQAAEWADCSPERSVVIVVRGDEGVVGIWAGADLDEVVEIGTTRSGADLTMPGDIHIPEYVRRCTFQVKGIRWLMRNPGYS